MSYSKSADPRVERHIQDALDGIRASLAASPESSAIRAVALGGGYGRGEGGATPDGMPYNDMDFFVVMNGKKPSPELRRLLDAISAEWRGKLAIDIDFCCVKSLKALCKEADTLMIQELFAGSRIIFGDEHVFDNAPRRPFSELPWTEAARLLLNRGAGLLFARQRASDPAEEDFVRRNLHKAALGCGDAILVVHHDYRTSGTERLEALRKYREAQTLVYDSDWSDENLPKVLGWTYDYRNPVVLVYDYTYWSGWKTGEMLYVSLEKNAWTANYIGGGFRPEPPVEMPFNPSNP